MWIGPGHDPRHVRGRARRGSLAAPRTPPAFIEIIRFSGRRMYGWKEAKKLVPRPAGGVGRGENADGDRGGPGTSAQFFVARLGTAATSHFRLG